MKANLAVGPLVDGCSNVKEPKPSAKPSNKKKEDKLNICLFKEEKTFNTTQHLLWLLLLKAPLMLF